MSQSKRVALLNKLRSTKEGDDVNTLIEVYEELAPYSDKFRDEALAAWGEAVSAAQMVQSKSNKSWKAYAYEVFNKLYTVLMNISDDVFAAPPGVTPIPQPPIKGGRTSTIGKKFDRCVKTVRRTVRPRKGSTKESAAIAICTTTILHPRKRTIKRYRKGRLVTQRRKAF
jgi:hypothetical protein